MPLFYLLGHVKAVRFSSFVGLAVMIVLIPAPALVASMMQGVQTSKMKSVRRTFLTKAMQR